MLNKTLLNTLVLAALSAPALAMAEDAPASPNTFTANVGLVTDYLYRGISQTNGKPALQGGFDYAHASGFYAGVWGSSISWLTDAGAGLQVASSSQLELDTYFGFKNSFADDFSYDVGFLRYNYPATYPATMNIATGTTPWAKADTNEVYGALGYKFLTAKYSYSLGNTFALPNAKGTNYVELNANYPIADTGITLTGHIGKQTYKGVTADQLVAAGFTPTYTDYKVGVTKDISGFVLGLAYSKTNAKDAGYYSTVLNTNLGKSKAVLSLTRAF
ncbi:MAG: hypothetical protein HY849_08115 [Nitrosomonadales bacterium]|nr:hypothetical protein [Nitrosomonadales bacterium]